MRVKWREWTADENVVLFEMVNHHRCGPGRIHHHEVGVRRNKFQAAGCGLAVELLAICHRPADGGIERLLVGYSGGSRAGGDAIGIVEDVGLRELLDGGFCPSPVCLANHIDTPQEILSF